MSQKTLLREMIGQVVQDDLNFVASMESEPDQCTSLVVYRKSIVQQPVYFLKFEDIL